jgi:pimeloyl-ACP methyl ester carboxylesterase
MVALNRCLLAFARKAPRLAECLAGVCLRAFWQKGEQVIPRQIETRLPPADKRALLSPDLRRALIASSMEALREGAKGAATDGLIYSRPWGFRLDDIHIPVSLWHGEQDVVIPPAMGRYLANAIPNCRATFYPDDGHFSLAFDRLEEILKAALA